MNDAWWEDAKRASVQSVAQALGYQFRGKSFGPTCPACLGARRSGKDRRMALSIVTINGAPGWRHWDASCEAWGDCVDLVSYQLHGRRLRELRPEQRDEVQAWFAAAGYCDPPPGLVVAPKPAKVELTPVQAEPIYPPLPEVAAMWNSSLPLDYLENGPICAEDEAAWLYLRRRRVDIDTVTHWGLAKLLPRRYNWPRWWGSERNGVWRSWGELAIWRLAVLAFDSTGCPRSLQARAVMGDDRRKTRWPSGYDAVGLLFACPLAVAIMTGETTSCEGVLVVEGLTDWLAAATQVCKTGEGIAVFGAASGGFSALSQVPLPRVPVAVCTDRGDTGERYAETVRRALPHHDVRRTYA